MIFPYARRPATAGRPGGDAVGVGDLFIWTVGTINVWERRRARGRLPVAPGCKIGFHWRLCAVQMVCGYRVAGQLYAVSCLLYAMTLGTAQLVGVRDYRYLAIPVAALVVVGSFMSYDNIIEHLVSAQFYRG